MIASPERGGGPPLGGGAVSYTHLKCGSNNSDGTAFCASCGAPLSNEAPTPNGAVPNNNVPPQTPPQVKASRGLSSGNSGILYLILAIFGLGIVSYALMQNELNQLA